MNAIFMSSPRRVGWIGNCRPGFGDWSSGFYRSWEWKSRTDLYYRCCYYRLALAPATTSIPFHGVSVLAVQGMSPSSPSWGWGISSALTIPMLGELQLAGSGLSSHSCGSYFGLTNAYNFMDGINGMAGGGGR